MAPKRLRPYPTRDQLATWYARPHDHTPYGRGHEHRVRASIDMVRRALPVESVGDMSAGNGAIPLSAGAARTYLGDYAPGHEFTGPLEVTVPVMPEVALYVCCETLEHLDDPALALRLIRERAARLVLSTPIDCWDDTNGEHLWAWSREDVESLMTAAGWTVEAYDSVNALELYGESYHYGIWLAS